MSDNDANTADTIRLAAPQIDPAFWNELNNAGIKVRPDLTRSELWVACVAQHQTKACATREEALLAAIRWLTDDHMLQRKARKKNESKFSWDGLFRIFG